MAPNGDQFIAVRKDEFSVAAGTRGVRRIFDMRDQLDAGTRSNVTA